MSLFPAYSTTSNDDPDTCEGTSKIEDESMNLWLKNSSYTTSVIRTPVIDITSNSSSDESVKIVPIENERLSKPELISIESDNNVKSNDEKNVKNDKKCKKRKKKYRDNSVSRKQKMRYEKEVENVYFEDTFRDKRNLTVSTLSGMGRPSYSLHCIYLGFKASKKSKKEVTPRYYVENIDSVKRKREKQDTVIKRTPINDKSNENDNETQDLSWGVNMEQEQIEKTKKFNETLSEDPDDVQLWIKYIKFQDDICQFQRDRGTKDTRSTTTIDRKLSITNKALEKNPNSIELLKLKLNFTAKLLPADQFANEIESSLNKDSGNILLWQSLITATKTSLAICTVPKVLDLYSKSLFNLRQKLRTNSKLYDEQILEMLYRCLTFLRQSGLWEQMWETLRLNLTLNLNLNKDNFRFKGFIDERKLIGMEEVILTSRLPLNQLWLRVESLRESCHWISVSSDQLELLGDSRRFVLPEDVADFVQPIMSRNSSLKLSIYSLLALKVPILPTRDFIARDLKLTDLEWHADSIEVLLPLFYPSIGISSNDKEKKDMIERIIDGNLTSGPQYLKFHPSQEPYLDFIRDAFRAIAESFSSSESERTSVYLWWFRFERMLSSFSDKGDRDEGNKDKDKDHRNKKLKNIVKDFLKRDENRNNLYFYKEYALIEKEIGHLDNCIKILETAIGMQNDYLSTISDSYEKAALCNVFRSLFETLLDQKTYREENKDRILKAAARMVSGPDENRLEQAEEFLGNSFKDFLEQSVPDYIEKESYFLPCFECDLITCYAYILYVRNSGVSESLDVFEKALEHSKENKYLNECLYESTIALLHLDCKLSKFNEILKEKIDRALNLYPMNCYFLSIDMEIESEMPCWKLNRNRNGYLQSLSSCLAGRFRIERLENLGLEDAVVAAINKLLSIHRKLAKDEDSQRCPLTWRLYMLFLRERNLCEKIGEEVYHQSVAQCPWARGIYTDAAQVAPQLLTEIQDLIREKELRMHVTPEELDILRG